MKNKSKHPHTVMILLCFITTVCYSQRPDTLNRATHNEKAQVITSRLQDELGLNASQTSQVSQLMLQRFQSLERSNGNLSAQVLESVNQNIRQRLSAILSDNQYAQYLELRQKAAQAKQDYLRQHPGFAFSKEDLEMDF